MINANTLSLGKTTKRFQEMPPDIGDSCIGLQGKLLLDCHNSQAPNCIRHCCTLTQYCIQSGQYQPNFGVLSSCNFRIGIVFRYNFQAQFQIHFQSGQCQPNFGILSSCNFRIGIVFSYNQVQFKHTFNGENINQTLKFLKL